MLLIINRTIEKVVNNISFVIFNNYCFSHFLLISK